MARQKWDVNISGDHHRVEVRTNPWTASGEILVDNQVVDAWGPTLLLRPRTFTVAGKEAIIRWSGILSQKCALFVSGKRVQ